MRSSRATAVSSRRCSASCSGDAEDALEQGDRGKFKALLSELLGLCTEVATGAETLHKGALALRFGTVLTRLLAREDVGDVDHAVRVTVAGTLTDGAAMITFVFTGSKAEAAAAVSDYVQKQRTSRRQALRKLAALVFEAGKPIPGFDRNYCTLALMLYRKSGGNQATKQRARYLKAAASASQEMRKFRDEVKYLTEANDVRDTLRRAEAAAEQRRLDAARMKLRGAQIEAHRKRRAACISGTGGSDYGSGTSNYGSGASARR